MRIVTLDFLHTTDRRCVTWNCDRHVGAMVRETVWFGEVLLLAFCLFKSFSGQRRDI